MKKISRYLVLVLLVMMCFGCGKKGANGKNSDYQEHLNIKKLDDIKVEDFISFDANEIILKVTNSGKKTYNGVTVKSIYYNKNNEEVGADEVYLTHLEANKTTYVSQYLPMDENFEGYVPDRIEVEFIEDTDATDVADYMEKISASYANGEDGAIDVTIKNDTGVNIGLVDATVVFLKDGKPLSTNYISVINLMDEHVETIIVPTTEIHDDGSADYIEYDDVQIFINNVNPENETFDESLDLSIDETGTSEGSVPEGSE